MSLPFPRSWVQRDLGIHPDAAPQVPLMDLALAAKNPRSNTKAMLRIRLLGAGWDPAVVQQATVDGELPDLAVIDIGLKSDDPAPRNLSTQRALLAKKGFTAKTERSGISSATALWRSITHTSSWMVDKHQRRMVVVTGTHAMTVQRVSAGFITDLWRSHNSNDDEDTIPQFGRFNLLSWMSPEALLRWPDVSKAVDVAVVYGGMHRDEDLHTVLGYLSAMMATFKGLLIYEMLLPADVDPARVEVAARRHGVLFTCGFVAKNMKDGALNGGA